MHFKDSENNGVIPFAATEMDLKIVTLHEVREEEISYGIPCMWNLKRNDRNELIYKLVTDSQTLRMNLWLPGGKNGRKR